MMAEPLTHRTQTPFSRIAGIYLEVLKNRRFLGFALLMSAVVLPHFAFIGGSADIYITGFGLSEQQFGYFFAVNAAAIMAGSLGPWGAHGTGIVFIWPKPASEQ